MGGIESRAVYVFNLAINPWAAFNEEGVRGFSFLESMPFMNPVYPCY